MKVTTETKIIALMLNTIVIELDKKKRLSQSDKNILLSCRIALHNALYCLEDMHTRELVEHYITRINDKLKK